MPELPLAQLIQVPAPVRRLIKNPASSNSATMRWTARSVMPTRSAMRRSVSHDSAAISRST